MSRLIYLTVMTLSMRAIYQIVAPHGVAICDARWGFHGAVALMKYRKIM